MWKAGPNSKQLRFICGFKSGLGLRGEKKLWTYQVPFASFNGMVKGKVEDEGSQGRQDGRRIMFLEVNT